MICSCGTPPHYLKRVGVIDPGGVANLDGLWDWVGTAPSMGPESRVPFVHTSCGQGLCPEKLVNKLMMK